MRRLLVSLLVAALLALLGPRLVGPQNKSAGAAFVYEPPERFAPVKDKSVSEHGAEAWAFEGNTDPPAVLAGRPSAASTSVNVVLHHSLKEMSVDEGDLARLAGEMGQAFADVCTWSHRRHELRTRSDGARVGLIEGDCNREVHLTALGIPPTTLKLRKLQLIFPDDRGTSIVTATYPADQAARWGPTFEATINKASGVATRVPSPAPWTYAAWAVAGAVLGWLLAALVFRDGAPAKRREADAA